MFSVFKRSLSLIALLLVLWSTTAVAVDLCTSLKGLARKPVSYAVDGFNYDFFNGLKDWISTPDCSGSSVDWTSDWVDNDAIVYSSNGAYAKGAKVQYQVKGSTDSNTFSVSASVTVQMTLTKGSLSNPATATFGFDSRNIASDLAGRFAPVWQGSLKTTGSSGLGVYDDDLFDGAGAVVVDDCSSGSAPSADVLLKMDKIAKLAAEVNQRFRNFEAVPTALSGDVSARMAFPPTTIINSMTSSDVHLNGTTGFVAHAQGECRGEQCGDDVTRALTLLAGADTICQEPSLVSGSMYGSLHTTLSLAGDSDVYILGVRATTQAVFSCSQGYIAVSLETTAQQDSTISNRFSFALFNDDTRAAIAQVKAIPMEVHGRRCGYVVRDSTTIMTPVETDLFGNGRGGAFVDDVIITDSVTSQFQSAVATIQNLLNSKYPVVNDVYATLFSATATSDIATRYFAQVAHPTSYGLWSFWAEQFNGFAVARDAQDNQLILEINSRIHSNYAYEAADPSVAAMNSAMSTVHQMVYSMCGSACSSLSTAPTLSDSAITKSDLGIALSATIQIPTVSLSPNVQLANNARKQIKLIRRERAIEGSEDVHMEFIAYITASVASQQSTLDEVNLMYSSVFDKAAISKATLVSAVSGVDGPVGMGVNGNPFVNSNLDESSLSAFASSFTSASNAMAEKESMTLPSLMQFNDHANSKTLSQLISDLAQAVPRTGSVKVMDYFDTIRTFVEGELTNAGVIPFLSLDINSGSVVVDLTHVSVRRIRFETSGVSWAKNIPIDRTELTLQLSTRVSFTVNTGASLDLFNIIGYSRAQGFSLPVRSGMRVGLATAGYAETVVNLPAYSYVTVSFNGKMERGNTFNGVFTGNMTISDPYAPVDQMFSFTMTEDNRGDYSQEADPSATLAAFGDYFMFPSYIASQQIPGDISPVKKPLSQIIDFESSWRDHTAWVFSTQPFPYVFVAEVSLPFSGFSGLVNFTVNDKMEFGNCQMNIGSASTIQDLVSSMSSAISQCGNLASLIDVQFTVGNKDDYAIVFVPQYAGSLYNFVVSSEYPDTLMRPQSWSASRVTPDHLSWHDLYDGVYLSLLKDTDGYTYTEPQIVNVKVADANLVDSSRAQFYPTEIPSVFFPASWKLHDPPKKVEIDPEFDAENGTVNVNVPTTNAYVEGDVSVSMIFGMSLWCSLGTGVLPFSTSFTLDDGRRYDQVVVPASPDNTFTFTVTAEKRTTDVSVVPPLEKISQTITLTPGKLLLDALLEEAPKQLSGLAANMVTIEKYQDSAYPDFIQAHLRVDPYQADSNTLYVPLEFMMNPTKLVAFGSDSSYSQVKAMTSCPITKDFKLDVTVDTSSNVDGDADSIGLGDTVDCSGSIGVAEVSSCNAQLVLKQVFSVSSSHEISLLGDLHNVIGDRTHFSDWYNNAASISSVLKITNISFNVNSNTMSDLASETVSLTKNIENVPFSQLKQATPYSFTAGISTATPSGRALKSLSTTNRKVFCSGLKKTLEKVSNFVKTDSMNQIVPFTNQMLAPIYTALINDKVERSIDSVCDLKNSRSDSMKGFCEDMSYKFGYDICGQTSLSDDGLDLPLKLSPRTVYAPVAFQFDTQRFTNRDLSTAYGNDGDLTLETNITADVGMKIVFKHDNETNDDTYYAEAELDSSKTSFGTKAVVDSAPTVKAYLGSTIVMFDAKNLNVNIAVNGAMSDDSDEIAVDLDGSAVFDAQTENGDSTYTCYLNAEVPVLQHYFHRPANALDDTVKFTDSCLHGRFVDAVGDSLADMTLAHFFEQDPSLFFKQFDGATGNDLFNYILDNLTDLALAYVDKEIQGIVGKALDNIVGPTVAASIGEEISNMVNTLIKSGQVPDPTELEHLVLQTFTGILNEIFEDYLTQTINTPAAGGDNYTWELRFGGTTIKEMKGIDWACGEHGIADLEFKAMPSLTLQWSASFDLTWSKSGGISIQWPISPAFSGKVELDGSGLELSGSFLFLTADLDGSASVSATLTASPAQKDVNFELSASLSATGRLGLVAKIRQETQGEKANALGALPYVTAGIEASWAFKWGTQNPKPTVPASFKFIDPHLCLGSLIAEFMQQVTREVNRIIKPLDPIFGKDGILLKPIPGLSNILGDHCNVLSILEWTCEIFSSNCNVDTIRKLVNILTQIADDIEKIKNFMALFNDPQGCIDWGYVYQTFKVDWGKDHPTPEDPDTNGPVSSTPQEVFNDNIPQEKRNELHELMGRWAPVDTYVIRSDCKDCTEANATRLGLGDDKDKFGFHLDILQDFPTKLVSLLLGINVPLMSVSFPEASMSYGITWTIPVWPTPYIAVNIHAGATLTFRPPSIALMSDGVIDTVRTGNPAHLFRNLAVSTTTSFATGELELDGGAEGGISVIIAKVTVNFDITVKFIVEAKIPNFGGGDWVTFDTILIQVHEHGLAGAIQFNLQLRGGFRLYLQGCVNLLFWKKCWTIVSWDWDTTLWSYEPDTPLIDNVASSTGEIDSDTLNFQYPPYEPSSTHSTDKPVRDGVTEPIFMITDSAVMLVPLGVDIGAASLTHQFADTVGITWSKKSSLCSREYTIVINSDLNRPTLDIPNCDQVNLTIVQKGYSGVKEYSMNSNSLVPSGRTPIKFSVLRCMFLADADYGTKYSISGSPQFPVTIDTGYRSEVEFSGDKNYYFGDVKITGEVRSITWAVKCDNLKLSSDSITCGARHITFPDGTPIIQIAGMNSASSKNSLTDPAVNLTIESNPPTRTVEIVGLNSFVTVDVKDMKSVEGLVSVVGNSDVNNFVHIDMDTPVDRDIVATAYPTHISYNDSDENDSHGIQHANIDSRSYSMRAATGRTSTMRLYPPEGYERVSIDMLGASNAVLRGIIDGCDRGSQVNVSMYNEGTHTLVLGTNGKLSGIQCDMIVMTDSMTNDDTAVREIVINASMEERELVWEFNDNQFMVSDSANTNNYFRVHTSGLSHIIVHFSETQASQLSFNKQKDDGTEYVFNFPEGSSDFAFSNVKIPETHSPIIMNGPLMNVVIGDDAGSVLPLSKLGAVVVVPSGSNVILNSVQASEPTHLILEGGCVSEQAASTVPRPSDWFISVMKDMGVEYTENCNILVPTSSNSHTNEGFSTSLDITAGSGADVIEAHNPVVGIVADMGPGDDVVTWLAPDTTNTVFILLGNGADSLTVQSGGNVNVDLGNDEQPDSINLLCDGVSPSILHSSVFPVGVPGNSRMEVSHWDSSDTIKISRSTLSSPSTREVAVLTPDVDGAKVIYEMNHNTDYRVKKCTPGTSFAFSQVSQAGHATGTNVEVSLEEYDAGSCNVAVNGVANSEGSVLLGVDSNAQQLTPTELKLMTGAAYFGQLNISLDNVDSFGVALPSVYTEPGHLDISGSPANKEIFINIPTWTTTVDPSVKNVAIANVFGTTNVEDFNEDMMLISLGTSDTPAEMTMKTSSMKELNMVSGCVKSSKVRVLSDWMIAQVKDAGFTLDANQNCSAVFKGTRFLTLDGDGFETVHASGLGWDSARSLVLPASVTNVVLEEVDTQTSVGSAWTTFSVNNFELTVSKKEMQDAFHVRMFGDKSTLSVGSAVFDPSATFTFNCDDNTRHPVWNIALPNDPVATDYHSVFTDVNFTSNGASCSGRVNSNVCHNSTIAPTVLLGKGLGGSISLRTESSKDASIVNRYVKLTKSDGMNTLSLSTVNQMKLEGKVVWDSSLTNGMHVVLNDRSENIILTDEQVTKDHSLYLTASVHTGLSFPSTGNQSISFDGVEAAHFNVASHSLDLLGGKNATSNTFCFSPCDMCNNATWNEIRVHGSPCSLESSAAATCSSKAAIHVVQSNVSALLSVSCAQPSWDSTRYNNQCPVAFNANGAEQKNYETISSASEIIAGIMTVFAAIATALSATVLFSRFLIAVGKTEIPESNTWLINNLMRDFYNDQFSWASIVLTACIGGISDFDISNWNGSIDGLILEVKSLVFGWVNLCESAYSPVIILTWAVAIVAVILRIVTAVGLLRDTMGWRNALRFLKPIHAVVSSIALLLLPLAGYAVGAVMNVDAFVGVFTVIMGICIIASIPVAKYGELTIVRNIASYVAVGLPFFMAIAAGAGATRDTILSLLLICTIALPLCNTFVLWKSYFAGGDSRTKEWKTSLFVAFGLRAASLICGLIFISTLFFDLNEAASGVSYAFWFLWVFIPWVQLIPLVVNTKSSNIVLRWETKSGYSSINGETTPLRSNDSVESTSLRTVGNLSSDKAMSYVAGM